MAKKIKRGFGRIISGLIKVLGISSLMTAFGCSYEFGAMYGSPSNVYTVSGTVKDNDGKAVKGIRVGIKQSFYDQTKYSNYDFKAYRSWEEYDEESGYTYTKYEWSDYFDFTETDKNGNYKLKWELLPKDNVQFVLYAEDIDGEQNGSFKEKSSEIQFTGKDRTKDGSWVDYYEKKNISISLDKDNPAQ